MGMAVGETGNDGFALEINRPRRRAHVRSHRVVRADRDDTVGGDGDRLSNGGSWVNRQYLAVLEDHVGWPDERGCGQRRRVSLRLRRVAARKCSHDGCAPSCDEVAAPYWPVRAASWQSTHDARSPKVLSGGHHYRAV